MIDIEKSLANASKLLNESSDSATLDAEVILCHILGKNRSYLRTWPERELQPQIYDQFQRLIKQRHQGVPVAYITGKREFWSRDFIVNPNVLIPRPDTELLIELCLKLIADKPNARLIDLGTGSGIIAITLAAERTDLTIFATDLNIKALNIAKQNATKHQVKNIQFIQSTWFKGIAHSKFDLIISNPPYIKINDPHLSIGDVRFEPKSALTSTNKGLKDIKIITSQAHNYLKPDGTLLIEHGYDQKIAVQTIFNSFDFNNIKTYADLSNIPRVTTGQYKNE